MAFIRRRRGPPGRKAPKRMAPKNTLVKLIKKVATQVEKKHLETKYRSQDLLDNQPIRNGLKSGGTGNDLLGVIPLLAQGPESWQRNGSRIEAQRLNVTCQLDFDPEFLENFDGWVKVFFLSHKSYKNQADYEQITDKQLLDYGNGVTQDWDVVHPSYSAMLPVHNEQWSLLSSRVLRMSKNVEKTTGSATNPYSTNIGHSSHLLNFKLRCPKNLIYEDNAVNAPTTPTNHGIYMAMVWWASDSTQYDAETDVIRATVRSHLYYKDG